MLVKKRTSIYAFNFDLVFVTKYRKGIIVNEQFRKEMEQILEHIAFNNRASGSNA